MGLISRVSSRTYSPRDLKQNHKMDTIQHFVQTYKNDQLPDISSNPNIPIKETSNKSSEVLFSVELLLIIDEYMTHMNEEILRHQSIKAEITKEKDDENEADKENDENGEIGDVEDLLKSTLENGNLSNIEDNAKVTDKETEKDPDFKKEKTKPKRKRLTKKEREV